MKVKLFFLAILMTVATTTKISAQTDINNAQAIFIYNFLSHFKWPDNTITSNYVIGVIGKTSTYDYLKKYTLNRKVGNKGIKVVAYNSVAEAKNCQILLVANNKSGEMLNIKSQLANKSCLIIGEKSGTTSKGAAVDFRITDGKLRYKINQTNVSEHNLFVSKALLGMSL